MEIILKKDVEGVGFKDDIVTVKNGFGRNFLIPNGSAILATPTAKKVLAENRNTHKINHSHCEANLRSYPSRTFSPFASSNPK